jgi:hypothetical protein
MTATQRAAGLSQYLSPEPLLQKPAYVRHAAKTGMTVPTYAYANNNPTRHIDPTGLFTIDVLSLKQCGAGRRWNSVYEVGMEYAKDPKCVSWFSQRLGYDITKGFSMQGGTRLVFVPKGSIGDPAGQENNTVFIDCDEYRRSDLKRVVRLLIHELAHQGVDDNRCTERRFRGSKDEEEELAREGEEACMGERP